MSSSARTSVLASGSLQAIGGIGADADVCVLVPYLFDPDSGVAQRAAESIEEITGADFGIPDGDELGSTTDGVAEAHAWWEANQARYGCP